MQQSKRWAWLKSWEALMFIILCAVVVANLRLSEHYLDLNNLANIFHLSIEKSLVVLIMALVIINGEIDLSVASVMGLSATVLAERYDAGWPIAAGFALALCVGVVCGLLNGLFAAYMGIPSLIVTLAGSIGYRGVARILLEDRSVGDFPKWFTSLGQDGIIGPFPITIFVFIALFILGFVILQYSVFGRYVYAIGNNRAAAEYAGINAKQVKVTIFMASGLIAALAGTFYAARLGNVRANAAEGFELDIITIVLLGGVSIFGGTGTMIGVGLSLLVVLNLRNGMSLSNVDGNTQTSVIGLLLILSVLVPNLIQILQRLVPRLFTAMSRFLSKGGATEPKSQVSVHQ